MIGIGNQYSLSLTIGEYHNFLLPTDLLQLVIEERIGLFLPIASIIFVVRDEGLLYELRSEKDWILTIGKDQPEKTMIFRIQKKNIKRRSEHEYLVKLACINHNTDFISKSKIRNFNSTSKNVFNSIISEYFSVTDESNSSKDSMNWIQYNITDKKFLTEVWMHSYIPDSVILPCIHSDDKVYLRDLKSVMTSEEKWKLSDTDKDGFLTVGVDRIIESNPGFNKIYYDRTTPVIDLITGDYQSIDYERKPLFSLYGVEIGLEKLSSELIPESDNVHANYAKAYNQNVSLLSELFTTFITVTIPNTYDNFRLGDLVYYRDTSSDSSSLESEPLSGIYMISKVVYDISVGRTNTAIQLVRDYLNI